MHVNGGPDRKTTTADFEASDLLKTIQGPARALEALYNRILYLIFKSRSKKVLMEHPLSKRVALFHVLCLCLSPYVTSVGQ